MVDMAVTNWVERIAITDENRIPFPKIGLIILYGKVEDALFSDALEVQASEAAAALNTFLYGLAAELLKVFSLFLTFLLNKGADLALQLDQLFTRWGRGGGG